MFGIEDPQIWGGYLIAIVLAGAAAVYGLLNWNKGAAEETDEEESDQGD
ncbi:MAG: symporter small accessory protein [Methanomassiliicoccales archaeon]